MLGQGDSRPRSWWPLGDVDERIEGSGEAYDGGYTVERRRNRNAETLEDAAGERSE